MVIGTGSNRSFLVIILHAAAARSSTNCIEVMYGVRQYIRFGTYGTGELRLSKPYLEDVATPNFIILISSIDKIPRTILFYT